MLQHGLTPAEVSSLEKGLPRLSDWSPSILVPVPLQRLRSVEVLWFNEAWFLERGIDPQQTGSRRRICGWLVEQFGFVVRLSGHSPSFFSEGEELFHADRYGNTTGLAVHGGSGRACIKGGFQVKGIGVTPLAGAGANWTHSHGCASVEEGLREAIYASVAYHEFPHSAVPIIAVLGTELPHPVEKGKDGSLPGKRALIVRPAVVRPAHAERAPLFIRSITGFRNSQLDDVARTKDVIRKWSGGHYPDLYELFRRVADQIAFGRVNKLFNGGFFSSNISIFGELLDFGGMRATSDWSRALNLDHAGGFGDEMGLALGVLESLVFYFNKYQPTHLPKWDTESLEASISDALERAVSQEYVRMWGRASSEGIEQLPLLMDEHFCSEQLNVVNYKHEKAEHACRFHDALVHGESAGLEKEGSILFRIKQVLEGRFRTPNEVLEGLNHSFRTAIRYAMPRSSLYREELQKKLLQLLHGPSGEGDERLDSISHIVDGMVGRGRRHWRHLPDGVTVHAHVFVKGSSAVLCSEDGLSSGLWIEGIMSGDHIYFFSEKLGVDEIGPIDLHGSYASALLQGKFTMDSNCFELRSGRKIVLPTMQVSYPEPASCWISP